MQGTFWQNMQCVEKYKKGIQSASKFGWNSFILESEVDAKTLLFSAVFNDETIEVTM